MNIVKFDAAIIDRPLDSLKSMVCRLRGNDMEDEIRSKNDKHNLTCFLTTYIKHLSTMIRNSSGLEMHDKEWICVLRLV